MESFIEFPDYHVSDLDFENPKKITDANPQQKEYTWGNRVLIDYTNSRGKKLQATLTLPAGYQEGKTPPCHSGCHPLRADRFRHMRMGQEQSGDKGDRRFPVHGTQPGAGLPGRPARRMLPLPHQAAEPQGHRGKGERVSPGRSGALSIQPDALTSPERNLWQP